MIINCLDSIEKQTRDIDYEIVVVDNASVDGSQETIKARFPEVRLIESEENLGFGRANNLGAKFANGKYLFLLNSDTELKNNAISFFFEYMESCQNEKIGAIGAYLLNKDEKIIHSYGAFPRLTSDLIYQVKYQIINIIGREKYFNSKTQKKELLAEEDTEVDYITGADLFLKTEIFNQFGGFDERYFMYYEETDLQLQMNRTGYKMLVINAPKIYHLEKGSFRKSINQQLLLDKSRLLFYKKNFNKTTWFIYKIFFYLILSLMFFDRHYSREEKKYYFNNLQ
ncbi:MAG: glycosyltransferase family 2 protein [Paludibacteraceae bacterium]